MRLHTAVLALALAAPSLAWGQAAATPERVLRLSYVEGVVKLQAEDAPAPTTLPNRPLIPGDRLITQDGARAELALDTSAVRLDERTLIRIETLEATSVRMSLNHGVASLRLRDLLEDETFELTTANSSITLREPGEYRVEVQAPDVTIITVRGGVADVATPAGAVRVATGQRVRLEGRDAVASLEPPSSTDDFDDWVLDREVRIAEVAPPSFGFDEQDNYDELDRNGDWYDDPGYGRVWMPSYSYGYGYGGDPFGHGQWQRYGYGWSWMSYAPWGFFTFNSGRWAYLHDRNRWCWVPSPRPHTPSVARETHPFGHGRREADPRYVDDGGPAMHQPRGEPRERSSREVHGMGGSAPRNSSGSTPRTSPPQQPASTPAATPAATAPSHTSTMRPSSSSNTRTANPSITAPQSNVFASPKYNNP